MRSTWQREERRKEQLQLIRQQVEDGTLVIRKMTSEERAEFPRRARSKNPPRKRS